MLLIYQTNQMIAVEYYLRTNRHRAAIEVLNEVLGQMIHYLKYREIMLLPASDVVRNYCKTKDQKLDAVTLRQLEEYSDEVIGNCNNWDWPGYYALVDQIILPKIFNTFCAVGPRGEVRRF